MSKFMLFAAFVAFFTINILAQTNAPLLIGRVAHNQTEIAFTFAGKIWLVPRTGGAARRLTKTENE